MTWQMEALASALLLANVWLVARRSLWNYAFGIAAVSLYAIVFWRAHLFAAFALQGLFLGLNIHRLLNWRRSAGEGGVVPVQRMTREERLATLAGTAILALLSGLLLRSLS
jgi:nicotinamide mononucleotide transporter